MKIANIEQLDAERRSLEIQLLISKARLSKNIQSLQTEMAPVRRIVDVSKNLLIESNQNYSLVNMGLGLGIDAILRNTLLRNSSWVTRLVASFVAKNLLSNYIANNREVLVNNSVSWVKAKLNQENPSLSSILEKPKKNILIKTLLWVKDVTDEKPTLA